MRFAYPLKLKSMRHAQQSAASSVSSQELGTLGGKYIRKVTGIFRSLSLAKVKSSRLSLSMAKRADGRSVYRVSRKERSERPGSRKTSGQWLQREGRVR